MSAEQVANLTTDVELAEAMSLTLNELHALRKRHKWPCVRLGRFKYRFTADQVEQIIRRHTVVPAATKIEESGPVAIAGQTARSASRRRSA